MTNPSDYFMAIMSIETIESEEADKGNEDQRD